MPSAAATIASDFAQAIHENFAGAQVNPAQPEDQLKPPVTRLLARFGEAIGRNVESRTEAHTDVGVRPDVGVTTDGLLVGHIELKAPGKGARAKSFTDPHDREQFKKLVDHPNLLYTDGCEWALFRGGTQVGKLVRASGDVLSEGGSAYGADDSLALEELLNDFLNWEPIVPSTPKALAQLLAPLTRLLKAGVRSGLEDESSALTQLSAEWRKYFFPDADDEQFADAYSQTVTYALLLARVEGETDLHGHAVERLESQHGLLAHVLRWLADPAARSEVAVPVDLLERAIGAVDAAALAKKAKHRDLWLYFYEDFLGEYDPRSRKQRGVYYTPPAVVHAQVSMVDEVLRARFGKDLGIADDEVTVLDPAVGTGTYLLTALDVGERRVRDKFGPGAVAGRLSGMAERFYGFELLIGPYAVCHMRLSERLLRPDAGAQLPADGLHVYLTDTLESPNAAPPGLAQAPLFHRPLADENRRARQVKVDQPILVCIGNPPYYRQAIDREEAGVARQGGWIRHGDEGEDHGMLDDFVRGVPGVHVKNLYNLYVYFWRWAMWKVLERPPHRGVVSFITASSYLRGPGFAGMRRFMREAFDELWILDLGGEGRGARQSANVFDIQTPVAIVTGVRLGEDAGEAPARVWYARFDGTREEKYEQLWATSELGQVEWRECHSGWTDPLLPLQNAEASYYKWPKLTDLFPWQHSGVQFKRTWPIAPDRETLIRRWQALVSAPSENRAALLKETRDRSAAKELHSLIGNELLRPIADAAAVDAEPPVASYAYRSFDRQLCLADNRLGDFLRPVLWRSDSSRQLFLTSLLTEVLGEGPAAMATNLVPDLHHFRGSYGAKHVVPLWRDAECEHPNITDGLLEVLSNALADEVTPEDLFAYSYALLQAPSYTLRFVDELEEPGPRIPLTKDPRLFRRAVEHGRQLIWLHTFGERFPPSGERAGNVPQGEARSVKPVDGTPEGYPTGHAYDPETREIHLGEGVFGPVSPAVWEFSVSGFHVLGSWLDYRVRDGAGRKSSPLDDLRPAAWTPAFTEELLRVIWIIERTVALGPELDELLNQVIEGDTFPASELPEPTEMERKAPVAQ